MFEGDSRRLLTDHEAGRRSKVMAKRWQTGCWSGGQREKSLINAIFRLPDLDLVPEPAGFLVWGKPLRRLLPWALRSQFLRLVNFLSLFNQLERDRISARVLNRVIVALPDFEAIDTPVIWVCEFFTLGYAATLQRRLASRDWPHRFGGIPGDELVDQLRRLRQRRASAIGPIGAFVRPGSNLLIPDAQREKLPPGVEYIELRW